jgi:glutathione S-transferase
MKIYGHPWSINTRKVLMTFAEKGQSAQLVLIMVPKGEHKLPEHLARHPFGKVPVLEDEGFVLFETGAIQRYLDRALAGPALRPAGDRDAARVDQWISASDSYFAPHAQPLLVESMFRRFLGGERNEALIASGRQEMQAALDAFERALQASPYLAGQAFSLADIHIAPYVDYLVQTGQGEPITRRPGLRDWWDRVSARTTWQRVARSGPQPYDPEVTADVIEPLYR